MKEKVFSLALLVAAACTPPAQRLSPADLSIKRSQAKSVVIVHSRSGNTAALARVISDQMNADYFRLEVPEGSGDHFLSAPNRNKKVEIRPERIDLGMYELVFLGSPIWYWNPTAFIFEFIRSHDFTGKKVVLFYTNEGGLAEGASAEWTALVESRGGQVIDFFGINRKKLEGRPIDTEAARIVNERRARWVKAPGSSP